MEGERRGRESHLKTARWRLNERKKGVRKGGHLTEAAVLSGEVEEHVICKTLRGWYHFSPPLAFLPPFPIYPIFSRYPRINWRVCAETDCCLPSDDKVECMSRFLPPLLISCCENIKKEQGTGCHRATDEWLTALRECHSCLLGLRQSVGGFIILPFCCCCCIFLTATPNIWKWGSELTLTISRLRSCVVLGVKMKAWRDVKWKSLLCSADGTIHLPAFEVTKSNPNEETTSACTNWLKEFHNQSGWKSGHCVCIGLSMCPYSTYRKCMPLS